MRYLATTVIHIESRPLCLSGGHIIIPYWDSTITQFCANYKTSISSYRCNKSNSYILNNVLIENSLNTVGRRKLRRQSTNTALEIINIYIDYLQKSKEPNVNLVSTEQSSVCI